jgi:hypothetical protein
MPFKKTAEVEEQRRKMKRIKINMYLKEHRQWAKNYRENHVEKIREIGRKSSKKQYEKIKDRKEAWNKLLGMFEVKQ